MQIAARWLETPHHYKVLGLSMEAEEADVRRSVQVTDCLVES